MMWNVIGGFVGCFNEECPVGPSTGTFAVGDEWKSEAEAEPHIIDAWNTRADLVCTYVGSNDGGEAVVCEHVFSCGHSCEWVWDNPPRYCPECGARVEK